MADRVVERLARHNHPYPYEHRSYPAAGHLLGPPHVPTTDLDSGIFALGGTSQGQAAANADAWARVLTFLKNAYPGCEQTHEETGHVA
jgi:dienelactone hydrolase